MLIGSIASCYGGKFSPPIYLELIQASKLPIYLSNVRSIHHILGI